MSFQLFFNYCFTLLNLQYYMNDLIHIFLREKFQLFLSLDPDLSMNDFSHWSQVFFFFFF